MTKKLQKRDNHYYLERLRVDHPAIHTDYLAGKFKTPAEAFVVAGLRKPKTALDQLRSAWSRATAAERDAFKTTIGCMTPATIPAPPSPNTAAPAAVVPTTRPTSASGVIHVDGCLVPAVVDQINTVMARRGIMAGTVMKELGFKALNPTLGFALHRRTRINDPDVLIALEDWLKRNPA